MSAMSDMVLTIQEMIVEGYDDLAIAQVLNVPQDWVEAERESFYEDY
jgi:hypothetical protein